MRSTAVIAFTLCELIAAAPAAADEVDFARHVAPILREHCVRCHQGSDAQGSLDLSGPDGLLAGGGTDRVPTLEAIAAQHRALADEAGVDADVLEPMLARARQLLDELPALEQKLKQAGVPWTPGRATPAAR